MKREFNFISHLDNQDVAYVLARKKDYYAQLIQRCYRRYVARKKNKQRMMGIKEDEIEIETDEDIKRREKNKRFFFETSEYILPKHKDNFHQKISD